MSIYFSLAKEGVNLSGRAITRGRRLEGAFDPDHVTGGLQRTQPREALGTSDPGINI